jgi:hypothetical protein
MSTTGALVHGRPGGASRGSGGSWQTNISGPGGGGGAGARLRHHPNAALVIPRARVSRAPSYPGYHSDEEFMSPIEVSKPRVPCFRGRAFRFLNKVFACPC